MSILNTSLFATGEHRKIGVGFHNVGSGVLRASNEAIVKKIEAHYGERCGHIPLDCEKSGVLVVVHTTDIQTQMTYLSQIYGREMKAFTADELKDEQHTSPGHRALVVPYVNVPEATQRIEGEMGAESWGLPDRMVDILKNKADFYQLVDEFDLDGFRTPDYKISTLADLNRDAHDFLSKTEDLLKEAGLAKYPLGVMLRAAESDGNYGCCLVYEKDALVVVVPDGDADHAEYYSNWNEAVAISEKHLSATMNPQREARIVISRFLDMADSPGMSVVIINGRVESLRWNGQLQKKGSKACVGTSTYTPKNAYMARMQQEYEDQTAAFFETLLRKTAQKCGVDFASIRGVANIDVIIPGRLEERLQQKRGQKPTHYLAECNPRWTNYTDAIMTVIGANRQAQTINNMKSVIQEGIFTIDKERLPVNVDPRSVRELIFQRDDVLKQDGTRIICRMTKNPMGLIFAGDVKRAQQEFADIVHLLSGKKSLVTI